MNWLAHLALSPERPLARLGNLAGDFVKGRIEDLAPHYPPELVEGIRVHRQLDQFTDTHDAFRRSVRRLASRGLVAGIVVDIAYDHFLSRHWARYFDEPRDAFIARCYEELLAHVDLLPPRLARAAPRLADDDWLSRYITLEGVGEALARTAARIRFDTALAGSEVEVEAHYADLEADFLAFWPDVSQRAAELADDRPPSP